MPFFDKNSPDQNAELAAASAAAAQTAQQGAEAAKVSAQSFAQQSAFSAAAAQAALEGLHSCSQQLCTTTNTNIEGLAEAAQAAQQGAEAAKLSAQHFAQQSAFSAQQAGASATNAANSAAAAQAVASSLQPKCEYKLSNPMKSDFQVYSSVMKSNIPATVGQTTLQSAIDAADKALSNFITNLKFSKFQAADVSTSNNCGTSASCNVSSKTIKTVYDGQSTPGAFSFADGDYLKLIDLSKAGDAIKAAASVAASCISSETSNVSSQALTFPTDGDKAKAIRCNAFNAAKKAGLPTTILSKFDGTTLTQATESDMRTAINTAADAIKLSDVSSSNITLEQLLSVVSAIKAAASVATSCTSLDASSVSSQTLTFPTDGDKAKAIRCLAFEKAKDEGLPTTALAKFYDSALTLNTESNMRSDIGTAVNELMKDLTLYQLVRYNSADAAQTNPVTGKITNINCDYALFEGSNGKKTLFSLQSIISDGDALSFIGKNSPTTADVTSYSRTGSLDPLPFKSLALDQLKFGYGQVKINTGGAYTIPSGCTTGATDGCKIEATAANIAYANLNNGKYLQLSASDDTTYPYKAQIFNKNGTLSSDKGNMKLDNINDDYAIISNSDNKHALLSLKTLLTGPQSIEYFTGVATASLTADYIYEKAFGGSKTPLVWDNFLKIKFDPRQAGDTDYQPICLTDTKCVIDQIVVASFGGDIAGDSGIFDSDYLKFYANSNGSYALKLHRTSDNSVQKVVSNSGKIANGNKDYFLFVDNSNQAGILFRWTANFVGNPGDILLGSNNANTGLTTGTAPQGYFVGELNPSADDLDVWSVNELAGA